MGGPIVRTGTTPKFWQNWEQVFGNKKSSKSPTKTTAKKSSKKVDAGKTTKKSTAKKKK